MKERLLRIATEIQERIDSFKAAITARNAPEARALMPDVEKLGYTITTGQAEIILEVLANDIGKNFLFLHRTAITDRCILNLNFLDGTMDFLRELKRLTKPPTLHPDATRLNKILTACFERHDPITAKTIFHLMWDLGVKPTNKSVNIFENSLRELYRNPPFGENTTRIMFSQPDPAEMKILAEKYKKNKKPRQFS